MSTKTWIKIKRGFIDQKHREKMGVRIWLYLYMLDIVNWETGTIEGWTDQKAADDFGMEFRTLQAQRQQLQADGYISCEQIFQGQRIIVHNWTNPREYSGQVINEKDADGYMPDVTIVKEGTQSRVPIQTENRVPLLYDSQLDHKGSPPKQKPVKPPLDFVDLLLTQASSPEVIARRNMRARVTAALGLTPNWDSESKYANWRGLEAFLLAEDKAGRKIETWAGWYKGDTFRAKNVVNLTPEKIKTAWGLAFSNQTPNHTPLQNHPNRPMPKGV